MRRAGPLALWLAVALAPGLGCRSAARDGLTIAAASDLAQVLPVLAQGFTRTAGVAVTPAFGSSGLLARQLEQGAPFDVFASADAALVDGLVAKGVCGGATVRRYAQGRLVLVAAGGEVRGGLAELLTDPSTRRVALANPAHAPYGRAAQEALGRLGVADAVAARLVLADNVQQALRFVESGNADVGLVGKSLVVSADGGRRPFLDVPATLHAPLVQAAVACGRPPRREAVAFVEALGEAQAQATLAAWGFEPAEAAR